MAGDGWVEVAGVEGTGEADGRVEFSGAACDGGGADVSVGVSIGFSVPGVGALGGGRSEEA